MASSMARVSFRAPGSTPILHRLQLFLSHPISTLAGTDPGAAGAGRRQLHFELWPRHNVHVPGQRVVGAEGGCAGAGWPEPRCPLGTRLRCPQRAEADRKATSRHRFCFGEVRSDTGQENRRNHVTTDIGRDFHASLVGALAFAVIPGAAYAAEIRVPDDHPLRRTSAGRQWLSAGTPPGSPA